MKKYKKRFLKGLYETMSIIRACEESLVEPITSGEVKCPVHLYSGQEAVAAGVCAALKPADYVLGNHRSHGHFLAHGGTVNELIAEIFGKKTGCSAGRGGSMHLCKPRTGMMGSAPIVAGTISLALGCALASSIKKDSRIAVSFFGDGATGEGVLYESLNFAALRKLPVIFVCENNFYSTHMPVSECRPGRAIRSVAAPFGIMNARIDGNDVLKVFEAASAAVSACRRGNGPVFLECVTYRFRGHVGPDDNVQGCHTDIRPKSELARWRKRDPLVLFRKFLLDNGICGKDTLDGIRAEVDNLIASAYRHARSAPFPRIKTMRDYVFK